MREQIKNEVVLALMDCVIKPRYKVLYCTKSYEDLRRHASILNDLIISRYDIANYVERKMFSGNTGLTVLFNNGSSFCMCTAHLNAKGRRHNKIIADPEISPDFYRCVLDPMFVDYEQMEQYRSQTARSVQ